MDPAVAGDRLPRARLAVRLPLQARGDAGADDQHGAFGCHGAGSPPHGYHRNTR